LAEGAIPIAAAMAAVTSESRSPKRLEPTTTSKECGA
jgi:hypothetical protein